MTEKRNNRSPLRLTLPSAAVKRLAEAGVHCRPEIGLEYQRAAGRYVLRGRESGGATSELGRYVSFCADDGQRLPWLIRPDSLARNGDHAIVVAPLLVSIEMFRFERTYELLILRHTILETAKGKRPALSSQVVFRGWQGQLPLDLACKDKSQAGKIAPEFFDRAGEPRELPSAYVEGVQAVTKAVNCVNCSHPHFLIAKPSSVNSPILLPDRNHSFANGTASTGPEVPGEAGAGAQLAVTSPTVLPDRKDDLAGNGDGAAELSDGGLALSAASGPAGEETLERLDDVVAVVGPTEDPEPAATAEA